MGGWSGGEAEGLTKILFWHPNSISSDIFDLGDNTHVRVRAHTHTHTDLFN